MALQPGPDSVVVVANDPAEILISIEALANSPIRVGMIGDFLLAFDAAGLPFRIPFESLSVGPSVPADAIVTESGDPIVDEFGGYITL